MKLKPLKEILIDSALIAASVTMMLISAIYHLLTDNMGYQLNSSTLIFLAAMDIVVLIATIVLADIYKRRTVVLFNATIYFLSFISCIFVFSSTDGIISESETFSKILLAFFLPTEAFASIGYGSIVPAIVTFLLFAVSLASSVYVIKTEKKGGKAKY